MRQGILVLAKDPSILLGLLRAADLVVILIVGIAAYQFRHDEWAMPTQYWVGVALACILTAQIFHFGGIYRYDNFRRLSRNMARLAPLWMAVGVGLASAAFFSKTSEDFSRLWAGTWFVSTYIAFFVIRVPVAILFYIWRQRGYLARNTVIVGANENARRLISHLEAHPGPRPQGAGHVRRPGHPGAAGDRACPPPGHRRRPDALPAPQTPSTRSSSPCPGMPRSG